MAQRQDSDRRIMINQICPDTDHGVIQALFDACGTVEEFKVIQGPDGMNRGFGFVTMSTVEETQQALAQVNGVMPTGAVKALRIHMADRDRKQAPGGGGGGNQFAGAGQTQLYVAGFEGEAWEGLLNHIRTFGEVVDSKQLPLKPGMKGVGFVTISSGDQANAAVSACNGQALEGIAENLVMRISDKEKDSRGGRGGRGRGGRGGFGGDRFHPYGGGRGGGRGGYGGYDQGYGQPQYPQYGGYPGGYPPQQYDYGQAAAYGQQAYSGYPPAGQPAAGYGAQPAPAAYGYY